MEPWKEGGKGALEGEREGSSGQGSSGRREGRELWAREL